MEERKIGKEERGIKPEMRERRKKREMKGIEENRSGESGIKGGGEKVSATNITALMESLLVNSGGKTHTQLSLKSVKWPQLAVSSYHGYRPCSAVIVWLSPDEQTHRGVSPTDPGVIGDIITEMSYQLKMLPLHLCLSVFLNSSFPIFINPLRRRACRACVYVFPAHLVSDLASRRCD